MPQLLRVPGFSVSGDSPDRLLPISTAPIPIPFPFPTPNLPYTLTITESLTVARVTNAHFSNSCFNSQGPNDSAKAIWPSISGQRRRTGSLMGLEGLNQQSVFQAFLPRSSTNPTAIDKHLAARSISWVVNRGHSLTRRSLLPGCGWCWSPKFQNRLIPHRGQSARLLAGHFLAGSGQWVLEHF